MPQVDFYVLHSQGGQARERFACRLAEKAWKLGHRVYLHSASPTQARLLDDLLWTFRDVSFVPHDVYPDAPDSSAPVRIGHGETACPGFRDVLITLAPEPPAFFADFARIAEVVDQTPEVRDAGRRRYRFYRDQGATLAHHDIAR